MNLDDCHKILNTSDKNNINEIKKKYYQLAKIYHPDRGGNEKDFRRITDAYKILVKYKNNPNDYKNFIESKNIKKETNAPNNYNSNFHLNLEDEDMDNLFINLFESQKFIQKTKEAIKNANKYQNIPLPNGTKNKIGRAHV